MKSNKHAIMKKLNLLSFLAVFILPLLLCAETKLTETGDVYGWKGVTLDNGNVSVKVTPENGRIIYYGNKESGNILWVNPKTAGKTFDEAKEPVLGWANFGGDKFWPVPQADISQMGGRYHWPHDKAFEGGPVKLDFKNGRLYMTTEQSAPLGAYGIRSVEVPDGGTAAVIKQKLVRADGRKALFFIKTVTQIRDPDYVIVPLAGDSWFRYSPGAKIKAVKGVSPLTRPLKMWRKFIDIHDCYAIVRRADEYKGPCMFFSDNRAGWFCAVYEKYVYFQFFKFYPDEYYNEGNSIQVMISPGGYFEMEIMSPADMLKRGERIDSTVVWMLAKRPDSIIGKEEMIKFCKDTAEKALNKFKVYFPDKPVIKNIQGVFK
jgi:hypothetical protein